MKILKFFKHFYWMVGRFRILLHSVLSKNIPVSQKTSPIACSLLFVDVIHNDDNVLYGRFQPIRSEKAVLSHYSLVEF